MSRSKAPVFAVVLVFVAQMTQAQFARAQALPEGLSVSSPCESGERWRFGKAVPPEARGEFGALINGTSSVARSLSEAIAFRRDTLPGSSRSFADYWISRTLLTAGLPHSAYGGFASIALRGRDPADGPVVQRAALQCMTQIMRERPTFELPDGIAERISELLSAAGHGSERRELWETATLLLKQQVQQGRSKEQIRGTVALLRGGGAFEAFSLGIWAALNGDERGTAAEMERFLVLQEGISSKAKGLERHVDQARLVAARAYYALKKYEQAGRHLKLVSKASNELPQALSELAWSALGMRNYGEAIGAAIGLQSGGLRRVFAPETPMVLAMAMNELCQYPEALRAISQFRKDYEPSYRWLKSWRDRAERKSDELYTAAIAFLRKQKGSVPDRVVSEWVRSPVFQSSQFEINLLADEASAIRTVNKAGSDEIKRMARQIRGLSQSLAARLRAEKVHGISPALKTDLSNLLTLAKHYQRFRAAGPMWRALAANHEAAAEIFRTNAMERIAADLFQRNQRMLGNLEEIAENNRLIEVEIFDGASQDIIWQNAHPDYKGIVRDMHAEKDRIAAAKVWNWGKAPIGSDAWSEVWEDEIGAFQSNLFNNCSNKEKYLAIKKSHLRREIARERS